VVDTFPFVLMGNDSSRPVVLFLHGFLGSRADWQPVADALSDDFRPLVTDLPGHGLNRSRPSGHDFTMENCAGALLRLLDSLHLGSVNVIGYSMGGRLGLYLALTCPDRCRRVVLESSSPGLKTASERKKRIRNDNSLADRLERDGLDAFLEHWYSQPMFKTLEDYPDRRADLLKLRRQNDPVLLATSLRSMGTGRQPSLWERLSACSTPLLLLAGGKDRKFSALAEEMAHLCPAAQSRIIPGAGHNVHVEKPAAFIREVRDFLKSTGD